MQTEPNYPWMRELVAPAFFILLGAVVGFLSSQLSDYWKAKRAKKSFARAIGMELDALNTQLVETLRQTTVWKEKVRSMAAPALALRLRTSVFSSQIGKLSDVADPLMIEVIHFYSDLGTLEQVFEEVNRRGDEYNHASVPSGERDAVRLRLTAALSELEKYISAFSEELKKLRAKLPPSL
jgi:hypothetical protein